MRQCLLGFMSSRDGLIARWIRKARRAVLKWTLFLSLFNLLCWTRRCSPLNLRRWPLHPSDNSQGRVVVFVRLNWLLLISLADLCPEPMGCVSVLLSLLTVREKTKTNRCGQVCICETSVWVWLRQHLSSDLPVGAVDAPCLVAGLVAVWLRATGAWLLCCLGSKTKTFSCTWQGYSYKFRYPMGVVCDPVPSIYDLAKLCQKFLVLLLSFSRMSQAIKEPI